MLTVVKKIKLSKSIIYSKPKNVTKDKGQYLPQTPTAMKAMKNMTNRTRQITSVQLLHIA